MERFKITNFISLIGIIANIFLFIIKIIVGLIFKSQAMLADSFNSIGDSFASLMSFIGNKIASSESDDDHNFGHGKAEYIFSMFISISILVIAVKLLFDSTTSLIFANKLIFSYSLIYVSIITILVKLSLYLYTRKINKKENNILIKSNMIDHRNDIFLTFGVLIASIFAKFNIFFIDSIIGIIISACFLNSGIKLFKDSYDILMDISIDSDTKNKILKLILNNKSVLKVNDIHSVAIGYKFIVFITISVDGNLKTFNSHEIATSIENEIVKYFDNIKEVFVHINPI